MNWWPLPVDPPNASITAGLLQVPPASDEVDITIRASWESPVRCAQTT